MKRRLPPNRKRFFMPDKSILQMRDRQQRVFRIACDPARYGLTLKLIAMDSGLHYDSVRHYASGETVMPVTALAALVGVVPDELLSLLLPGDRLIVRAPEDVDHDAACEAMRAYVDTKERAHHPESECGREIGPNEDAELRAKLTVVRAAA
jgi:hypothetical protein